MNFTPPINTRTTKELLEIAADHDNWNREAFKQACAELQTRKVDFKQVEHTQYIINKGKKIASVRKAQESFDPMEFVFKPLIILLSTNLEEDGYFKKAKQQKIYRIIIGILILTLYCINKLP